MENTEPKLAIIESFYIGGIRVRTSNQDEFNPSVAKLPALWGRFYSENISNSIPGKIADSAIYAVYSEYQSDANGLYSVTVGVKTNKEEVQDIFHTDTIVRGHYLVFSKKGSMPQAVVSTWHEIWNFFNDNQQYKRNFKTDFEEYPDPETVLIYIGIN